jgi:hypothetical protein
MALLRKKKHKKNSGIKNHDIPSLFALGMGDHIFLLAKIGNQQPPQPANTGTAQC